MKHFHKILLFFIVIFLAACDNKIPILCKTACPMGQKQKLDCSCYAPEKKVATEEQQKEILQALIKNDEQTIIRLISLVSPDSPLNLELLQNKNALRKLYSGNADISNRLNYQNDNLTLLSLLAPLQNFNETFNMLLRNGANPNLQAFAGLAPIEIAIVADQGTKVKMLLDAGAEVYFEGENNILEQTLNLGKYRALQVLASFAKEKNITFSFPSSYFMQAMLNNQIDLAKAILPLINKDTLNVPNNFGVLPLVQAAFAGDKELMGSLIKNGADIELKDENNRTPLLAYLQEVYIAQIEGNYPKGRENQITEIANYFLVKGADINAKDLDGENIVFYAVRSNNRPLLELLVTNYKQDLNPRNNQGETPLFMAAQNNPGLVSYLLSKGANPKVMDENGRTPAIAAAELGNMNIYDLLESAASRRLQ